MPYKYETLKLKIPRAYNRNVKVGDDERENIKLLYDTGVSIRAIARKYKHLTTRRNIQFILFPERARHVNKNSNANRTVSKKKHAEYIKSTRRYKQELMKKSILIK